MPSLSSSSSSPSSWWTSASRTQLALGVAAAAAVGCAWLYLLRDDSRTSSTRTSKKRSRQNRPRKPTVKSLASELDAVLARDDLPGAHKACLVEKLQLTLDGLKPGKRRKALNRRIEVELARLPPPASEQSSSSSSSSLSSSSTTSSPTSVGAVDLTYWRFLGGKLAVDSRGEAEGLRGYRRKADGSLTTFFHRDIDAEAKRLIGDTAPKRILPTATAATSRHEDGGGSCWNASGTTWESKDCSSKARDTLEALLGSSANPHVVAAGKFEPESESLSFSSPSLRVRVESATGDAILKWRGGRRKPALIFDLTVTLSVERQDADTADVWVGSGKIVLEVTSGDLDDPSMEITVPAAWGGAKSSLRADVRTQVSRFEQALRSRVS